MIEIRPDEIETAIIEMITILAAFVIIGIVFFIRKKYANLTKKGYGILILGFVIFALHLIFDFLDTIVAKKIDDETTLLYTIFDFLDATFAFIGLFVVGFAFYKIAQSGIEIWEGKSE